MEKFVKRMSIKWKAGNVQAADLLSVSALVFLFVLFSLTTGGNFLKESNLRALMIQSCLYIVAACGVLFVMSHGNLELSVGGIIGIATAAGCIMSRMGGIVLSFIACVCAAVILSSIIALCHIIFKVPAFIAGIALMFSSGGIVSFLLNSFPKTADPSLDLLNHFWFLIGLTVLVYFACGFVFHYTKVGKYNRAIGSNQGAAYHGGISLGKYKYLAYLMYGICCGVCAFLIVVRTGSFSIETGASYETEVLLMLIIGGMPMSGGSAVKMRTPFIGAMIYMILRNGLTLWGVSVEVINMIRVAIFFAIAAITYDRSNTKFVL